MKILFTSPVLEHPPAGGSQLRVENSIKALAQVCEMDIISRSPPSIAGGETAELFYKQFAREFLVMPGVSHLSANKYIRRLQRDFANLGGKDIRRQAQFLVDHARRRGIGIVWFGYGNISHPLMKAVKAIAPELKLVCDTDSVWSRFVLRALPYAKGLRRLWIQYQGAKKEYEERAWVNMCDVTTAVSEFDADYYRSLTDTPHKVQVFSNVIDVDTYQNPPPSPARFNTPCIYLAGVFGHTHSPMDVAARWMLEEVLPLIRKQRHDVHFYIVGKRSDERFGHLQDPNITVTGQLPSVLPYLCNADVALVPLKFESGTRYKILEAGACKVPLVSTTLGAEGLPVRDGEHLLIADTPADFAAATLRLLDDKTLAARLAENCYKLVYEHYGIATLKREAAAILEQLLPQ